MSSLNEKHKWFLAIYNRHVDAVYRVCYSFMKHKADAEDLVQETFIKLLTGNIQFESERHERAWLIVTASNLCKDSLKKWWRKNENLDDYLDLPQTGREEDSILEWIMKLPNDYKDAVYMYYYEGYSTAEIAAHKNCPDSTIRSRLMRAKKQLQSMMGGVVR